MDSWPTKTRLKSQPSGGRANLDHRSLGGLTNCHRGTIAVLSASIEPSPVSESAIDLFVARWAKAGGTERANYQLFLTELCALLEVPLPDPAGDDTRDNGYVFERRVVMPQPDGTCNNGFIDLYRRGSFVLEAKQTGKTLDSSGWDKAMLRAHNQADQYARALPAEEGRPPFILVVDVGRNIELYAEFSRSGATYTPYPDARSHRIRLEDLQNAEIRARLRAVWLDPLSLDPSRRSARVTREIANQLASLAKSLEADGHKPEYVASFLMRALFTMFSEDVGLLPERSFTNLLHRLESKPENFAPMVENLWQSMDTGGFSPILESKLLRFNGGLFADSTAIPLNRDQLALLARASDADWRYVEPAIFGTLLERALNPRDRHKLGAHFTPRAYVERLVLPTVIEPLRAEWREVQAAALTYEQQGKHKEAVEEIRTFHRHLCTIRVLDPACGSGNFLYVTLEHMKRLEGEILNLLHDLGESQGLLELEGVTVDPHQFLGLEVNPRAARIAEMVLWIGYLQWHFRTHGRVNPPEPVLRDFRNIENRDALIVFDRVEDVLDADGKVLTRWDGITTKLSPVTGELIPDETAQVAQQRYINPTKTTWPQADYIVGNPPFVGCKKMRATLGDGYVDAVRGTWPEVPDSADFVMFWWHIAAEAVRSGQTLRFGFITTNSIKQTFNRRVLEAQISAEPALNLAFAIPDHPWVDAADGAAVRIAMTVGAGIPGPSRLLTILEETESGGDEREVLLEESTGRLHADLRLGANLAAAVALKANSRLTSNGVMLAGSGFIVPPEEVAALGLGRLPGIERHLRPYCNGRDLLGSSRGAYVIDLFGLQPADILARYPELYQRVVERVKVERDHNNRPRFREKWWEFGEPRKLMRSFLAGLSRYVATIETAKHRIFVMVDGSVLPDHRLIVAGFDDIALFGVLSSRVHVLWALAAGGTLEDRPVYNKTRCYDTFPFPAWTPEQAAEIRQLAEQIDGHRRRQQALHPALTLTGMYNVLERLRNGEPLTAKERVIHEQGLVAVLGELHDRLDRAVLAAYGWEDLTAQLVGKPGATAPVRDKPDDQAAAEEELLCRLVALGMRRAAEEARGEVRWLRPEYQQPGASVTQQTELDVESEEASEAPAAATGGKAAWPKNMRDQVAAVRAALQSQPQSVDLIAARYKRSPKVAVQAVLGALEELGMVGQEQGMYRLAA